ncbi:uncharacterized protein LOC108199933 [Daucus carota subsp. sativus]
MYNYMKKKGLDHVADTFTQEAKIDTSPLLDSEEGLLKEWWEVFWPQFSSMMENNAPGNSQFSTQSSMQAALAMLPSLQAMPVGNSQNKVIPSHLPNPQIVATGGSSVADMMEQPPVLATTPIHNQRRAGKLPMNTETDGINPGKSSAQAIRKGPLGFPPVNVHPTQLVPFDVDQMVHTAPPPSGNPSNLHVQAPVRSPLQVTKDPRNDVGGEKPGQMESNGL